MKSDGLARYVLLAAIASSVRAECPSWVPGHEERWSAAILGGDTSAMAKLLSDSFVGVTDVGSTFGKNQWLVQFAGGTGIYVQFLPPKIRKCYGDGPVTVVGTKKYKHYAVTFTHVWQRNGNAWQLILSQETPIVYAAQR